MKWSCLYCGKPLEERAERCMSCGGLRPPQGWGAPVTDHAERWIGRTLEGRYVLRAVLGRGSHSVVYLAEAVHMERRVAAKLIDLTLMAEADASWLRQRIEREASILGSLHDPHIVSIVDVLEPAPGYVCLVMDYVKGCTLHDEVTQQRGLPVVEALGIFRQIVTSVAAAHEAGVVHRDLKPENIMIEQLALGERFVRLLDFGVAVHRQDPYHTSRFIGTPSYASPEQIMGEPVDQRGDIYALGLLLYFMLVGRPPFEGRTPFVLFDKHLNDDVPSLEGQRLHEREVACLDVLIADMTRKAPEARLPNLAHVLARLDELWRLLPEAARGSRRVLALVRAAHTSPIEDVLESTPRVEVEALADEATLRAAITRGQETDALVVDVMATRSALELCRFTRTRTTAPIILIADMSDADEVIEAARALELGADAVIPRAGCAALLPAQLHALMRRAERVELARSGEWMRMSRTTGEWLRLWQPSTDPAHAPLGFDRTSHTTDPHAPDVVSWEVSSSLMEDSDVPEPSSAPREHSSFDRRFAPQSALLPRPDAVRRARSLRDEEDD